MRKIKRRKNYTKYLVIATICIFSCMGIGYSYLQESLNLNVVVTKKDQKIDITENIVTSGDGLYEDSYEDGRYIYRGKNSNNYIWFNEELWRIISKESDGTYKIIKDEILETNVFDEQGIRDNGSTQGGSYCQQFYLGCDAWAANYNLVGSPNNFTNSGISGTVLLDASINTYLNHSYYDRLNETAKNQLTKHDFYVGGVRQDRTPLAQVIQAEKKYIWNGNIGLISISDFLRAGLNESLCGTVQDYISNYRTCNNLNWMLLDTAYFTLTPYDTTSPYASTVFYGGSTMGFLGASATVESGIRPTLYLNEEIVLYRGTGTKQDPYQIQ